MPYAREKFIDPSGALADYLWEINHSDEDDTQFQRNIERTTTTSGVGFVRQQGDDSPIVFRWTGTILTLTQIQQMLAYYAACKTRTIHLRDFEGHVYEIIITNFTYKRVRTLRNPRDPAIRLHYYTYTLEFEELNYLGDDFS